MEQQVLTANDLYAIAADLAETHGDGAMEIARRAVVTFEAEGAIDRAKLWFTLCVFLDDLAKRRGTADRPVTIH